MNQKAETTWYIDADTVHNWTALYARLPYYADLPAHVRAAVEHAHTDHFRSGHKTAGEWADALAAKFPELVKP